MKWMLPTLKQSLCVLNRTKWLVLLLFAWQLAWSGVYYYFGKGIVGNVMQRWPGESFSARAEKLFSFEWEFLMLNTSFALPTLAMFGVLLGIRLLLSPLIQAGVYGSLHRKEPEGLVPFLEGIIQYGAGFYVANGVKWILIITPLYWMKDVWTDAWMNAYRVEMFFHSVIASVLAYFLYILFIHMVTMWIQIVMVKESQTLSESVAPGMWFMIKHCVRLFALYGTLLFVVAVAAAVLESVLVITVGWVLLIGHQLAIFVRLIGRLWMVSSSMEFYEKV